jgi:hypothetical protein
VRLDYPRTVEQQYLEYGSMYDPSLRARASTK